jgi:hypothetical protein
VRRWFGPLKGRGSARFCASGLVVRSRNDTPICSLNARLSPTGWELADLVYKIFSQRTQQVNAAGAGGVAVSCAPPN